MKKALITFLAGVLMSAPVLADALGELGFKRVQGVYKIYGGSLGDEAAPSRNDKKIMFSLTGTVAKDMFDAIGPDVKDACTEGKRHPRQNTRQGKPCLHAQDRWPLLLQFRV